MKLVQFTDARTFSAATQPLLTARETENGLMLGILHGLVRSTPEVPPLLVLVEDSGSVVAAALQTPPFNLLVSGSEAAVEWMARELDAPLPGVLGRADLAHAFARGRAATRGGVIAQGRAQRLYELRKVSSPPPVAGRLRTAQPDDIDWLTRWAEAFVGETGVRTTDAHTATAAAVREQRLFVWDDAEAVSMACWQGPTPNGVRLGFVYTPPRLRGRGYARACVAALSQQLLDAGRKFCS